MRVAIVGHSAHGGGAEFVTRTWMEGLVAAGHEVVLFTTDRDAKRSYLADGFPIVGLHRAGNSHLRKARVLRGELARRDVDVCLGMQTYPSLVLLLATRGRTSRAKILISERNIPSVLLRREGRSQRLQLRLAKLLYRTADGAVAISHPTAADLVGAFALPPEKVFVVPNPVLAKRVHPVPPYRSEVLQLVMPSRLVNQKRPTAVVDAAAELRRRGVDVRILCFGDGPLRDRVATDAAAADVEIELRGWQEEWTADLKHRSVVVLPSYCEGFGNVLVEAAAAGIPSVAVSGALGVADAIVPGLTGELALTADPGCLADAVERAVDLEVSAERWLARFSVENSVATLLAAFHTCR